jgi:polysaccharide biosynthesis/export protein
MANRFQAAKYLVRRACREAATAALILAVGVAVAYGQSTVRVVEPADASPQSPRSGWMAAEVAGGAAAITVVSEDLATPTIRLAELYDHQIASRSDAAVALERRDFDVASSLLAGGRVAAPRFTGVESLGPTATPQPKPAAFRFAEGAFEPEAPFERLQIAAVGGAADDMAARHMLIESNYSAGSTELVDFYNYRVAALHANPAAIDLQLSEAASASPTAKPVALAPAEGHKTRAAPKLLDVFKYQAATPQAISMAATQVAASSAQEHAEDATAAFPEFTAETTSPPNRSFAHLYDNSFVGAQQQPEIELQLAGAWNTNAAKDEAASSDFVIADRSVLIRPSTNTPTEAGPPAPMLREAYADDITPKVAVRFLDGPHHSFPNLDDDARVIAAPSHGPGNSVLLGGCPYYPAQSGAHSVCGVDCGPHGAACNAKWDDARCIPWSLFGPGEYVGPARTEHVSTYYLRVNDLLTLTYIAARRKHAERYRIGVGDKLRIESSSDDALDREVQVQPDGDIMLPLIGEVTAAGKTVKDLREELVQRYRQIEQEPLITVTPLDVNIGLQEILKAVTSQSRSAGQALELRVTPEGTIQAPGVGSVFVQGLTLDELRTELEARYAATFGEGLLISPALTERATSYVFVGGEVATPGRYVLEGPTTVMQAIALAGGWNNGGNVRQVVVFRRDENWCLKATKIDVHRPLYGKDPCPVNDVWLRDNDLVIVPKQKILCAADVIELYFTRGVYAVFPITFVRDFSRGSLVVP